MTLVIRDIIDGDLASVCDIYNYYVASTIITFEEASVDVKEMSARVDIVKCCNKPWLVAENTDERGRVNILGYAYASQWRARSAYRYASEATIYLAPDAPPRKGLGFSLYSHLLELLAQAGDRTVIGVVGLPNDASVGLHEKCGFAKVAHLDNVGYKFERWLDVGYWQKNFL